MRVLSSIYLAPYYFCCKLSNLFFLLTFVPPDTYLVLVDSSSLQVAYSDDSLTATCRPGSEISYLVPLSAGCQQYTLREGCYDGNACSGTAGVLILGTLSPTSGN